MTAVEMLLVNVGPQVSTDVSKGDGSVPMRTVRRGGARRGEKWHFLRTFFMDELVSRNLSRKMLSRSQPQKLRLAEN